MRTPGLLPRTLSFSTQKTLDLYPGATRHCRGYEISIFPLPFFPRACLVSRIAIPRRWRRMIRLGNKVSGKKKAQGKHNWARWGEAGEDAELTSARRTASCNFVNYFKYAAALFCNTANDGAKKKYPHYKTEYLPASPPRNILPNIPGPFSLFIPSPFHLTEDTRCRVTVRNVMG